MKSMKAFYFSSLLELALLDTLAPGVHQKVKVLLLGDALVE